MKNDGKRQHAEATGSVESSIVNHPKAQPGGPTDRTDVPPSSRA